MPGRAEPENASQVVNGELLDAGSFSEWLASMTAALRGDGNSEVPCGRCTACCTSSQFVHIEPDETDTLARIPEELLFPAPRMERGHLLMGYDEHGRCPMLADGRCSIYEHRPRTCRVYDCRIFAASGLAVDEAEKAAISRQVARWRFSYRDDNDRARHRAVQLAADYLSNTSCAPGEALVGLNATGRSLRALEVHDLFLQSDEATGQSRAFTPGPEVLRTELGRQEGSRDRLSR
jgi:Fe-S-cluster containining protein